MAKKKNLGRDLHGLLVLDKSLGMSSNQALQRAKYLFKAKKAGHTGTLDPLATGVLVICFGKATKAAQHVMDASKVYAVVARLGEATDTGDKEGEIVETKTVTAEHISKLPAVCKKFVGEIAQTPPMFSALKQNGVPLYKLAREGVSVPREARRVNIYALEVVKVEAQQFEFIVRCSKGTYVRTLVEDIGRQLGCGAHVAELRRLQVGVFGQDTPMYTLAELERVAADSRLALDRLILPIEKAFGHYPKIELKNGLIQLAERGVRLKLQEASHTEYLRVFDSDQVFRGLGQLDAGGYLHFQRFYKQ